MPLEILTTLAQEDVTYIVHRLPAIDNKEEREAGIAKVLTALMREVDPLTLVDTVEATVD